MTLTTTNKRAQDAYKPALYVKVTPRKQWTGSWSAQVPGRSALHRGTCPQSP
jgi:hypothetical protein